MPTSLQNGRLLVVFQTTKMVYLCYLVQVKVGNTKETSSKYNEKKRRRRKPIGRRLIIICE